MMRLLLALVLALAWTPALAQKKAPKEASGEGIVNKLFGPGPLIKGHQNLEHGDCLKCHDAGNGVPNAKCLDCHKTIAKSQQIKTSLHGRVVNKPCIACHSDHKGRNFDSTKVDKKTFDHSQTSFALNGAHKKVDCAKCHKGDKFLGTDDSCKACHSKDDPHRFPPKIAAKECSACHTEVSWTKGATFDHKKETGYELIGKHAKLECKDCHGSTKDKSKGAVRYDFPQLDTKKCLTCHQDYHKTDLGPRFRGGNCDQCHAQTTWKITAFNHNVTGFPLRGGHAKVSCEGCHAKGVKSAGKGVNFAAADPACSSCHADFHGFAKETSVKLGGELTKCERCHVDLGWKTSLSFDHGRDTVFPIDGKHVGVKCFECHKTKVGNLTTAAKRATPRVYDFPMLQSKTCETCHKSPHPRDPKSVFNTRTCASCHVTAGWKILNSKNGGFDHDSMTRFKLTGDHAKLSCAQCHGTKGKGKGEVFKFPNADKQFCVSCHKSVHDAQFTPKFAQRACADCHDTVDFRALKPFDHAQTRFALTGAHTKVPECAKCHIPTANKLPTKPPKPAGRFQFPRADEGFCSACHRNVHKDQFSAEFAGKPCRECHTTTAFTPQRPFDHATTDFKLTGAHVKIRSKCQECHKPTSAMLPTKPPKPANRYVFPHATTGYCEACHKNEHEGQFRPKFAKDACRACHNTTDFGRNWRFDHAHARFDLKGKHKDVKCVECHVKTTARFKEPPRNLKGKFIFHDLESKDCAACHKDPHKGTFGKQCSACHDERGWKLATADFHENFLLGGVHYEVDCASCHGPEQRRLEGTGLDCKVCHTKDDAHSGSQPECVSCHTQWFWEATRFQHAHTSFPLRGAHRTLECAECHAGGVYQGLNDACVGCHTQDAARVVFPDHKQAGFETCETCHNQFAFPGAR